MAQTDPDMTRAYQKGHARKVLRAEMILPWSTENEGPDGVRDARPGYLHRTNGPLRENSLGIL